MMTRATMTVQLENILKLVAFVFAIAVAWTTTAGAVTRKVDRVDFAAESARVAAKLEGLHRIESKVDQIGDRVSAIYCQDKPPGCQ